MANISLIDGNVMTDSGVLLTALQESITPLSIGSVPNAEGITMSGSNLTLQPADETYGGIMTAGNQNFSGRKYFYESINAVDAVATENVSIGYASIAFQDASLNFGTILASNLTGSSSYQLPNASGIFALSVNSIATDVSGNITLSASSVGAEPTLGNPGISGYVLSSTTGGVRSWVAASGGGVSSLSAIGSAPNANAGTITGSVLNLQPASATFGGVITTGTQTFAGDKTFGNIYSSAATTYPTQLATKEYVDLNVSTGIHIHPPVRVETQGNLTATYTTGGTTPTITSITTTDTLTSTLHGLSPDDVIVFTATSNGINATYGYFVFDVPTPNTFRLSLTHSGAPITTLTNGTGLTLASRANSGVGAKLTNAGAQVALNIDSISMVLGNRVLVYRQTNGFENGVYEVTNVGSISTNWELTRAATENKYDPRSVFTLGEGDYFFIQEGFNSAGESYVFTTIGTIIFGTTDLVFTQFSAALQYIGGTNIDITGQTISLTGQVGVGNGGTGASTLTGILVGNGSSAITTTTGTALQQLRRNSANTAYEFFTPAAAGDMLLGTAQTITAAKRFNTGTLRLYNTGGTILTTLNASGGTVDSTVDLPIDVTGTLMLSINSNLADVNGNIVLGAASVGAEPALGNPSVSGYVLSSTTGGVRSWVASSAGGSPGGTTGEIQYNNAGAFAGAANVEVASGNLKLVSTTDPSTPTGGLIYYSKLIAGRVLPKIIGPSGIDTVMQVGLHGNSVFLVAPSNGTTTPTTVGGALTTATTISHQQTIASANPWQATRRTRFQTSTTAGNATGMRTGYVQWFRGSATGFGGFWFRCQLGMNINLNGGQKFVGLCASTAVLAAEPSALLNMCGMGFDSTDLATGNWFFMYNDGTGTATKVDLLATNAARNTTAGYDLIMYMAPGGSELFVRIINLATNVTVLETSYTTLLPVANTGMAFKAEVRNGAVAAADNLEIAKVYIETDY